MGDDALTGLIARRSPRDIFFSFMLAYTPRFFILGFHDVASPPHNSAYLA